MRWKNSPNEWTKEEAIGYAQAALDTLHTNQCGHVNVSGFYRTELEKHGSGLDALNTPPGHTIETIETAAHMGNARQFATRVLRGEFVRHSPSVKEDMMVEIVSELAGANAEFSQLDPSGKLNSRQVETILGNALEGAGSEFAARELLGRIEAQQREIQGKGISR